MSSKDGKVSKRERVRNFFSRQEKSTDSIIQTTKNDKPEIIKISEVKLAEKSYGKVSIEIWNDAYRSLKTDQSKLVESYEKVLTQKAGSENLYNSLQTANDNDRVELMIQIVQKLQDEKSKHETFRENVVVAIDIFDKVKDYIGSALETYPPAALAFSGFCLIAPVITSALKQTKSMIKGLSHMSEQLDWYMSLTQVIFRKTHDDIDFKALQGSMRKKITKLYQSLLEFQMKAACKCYDNYKITYAIQSILGIQDWEKSLQDIKDLESSVRTDLKSYNDQLKIKGSENVVTLLETNNQREDKKISEETKIEQMRLTAKFATRYEDWMMKNPNPCPNTCFWFINHDKFKEWLTDEPTLLLASADPGCGKSVLSKHLVKTYLPKECPNSTICYFFFKDESEERTSIDTCMTSLIHQLFSHHGDCAIQNQKLIEEAGKTLELNRNRLWSILENTFKAIVENNEIICILDALDEMDSKDLEWFSEKLQTYFELSQGKKPKILLTTRGYPEILKQFHAFQHDYIYLQGENKQELDQIQAEIDIVINFRLDKLKSSQSLDENVIQAMKNKLNQKSNFHRTYLYVHIIFSILDDDESDLDSEDYWIDLIDKMPRDLITAYEVCLKKVKQVDHDDVRLLFSLVLAAAHPLTTTELNEALSAWKRAKDCSRQIQRSPIGPKYLRKADKFEHWIRKTCKCFLSIYDSKVYFIHQTVKEFLLGESNEHQELDTDIKGWKWYNSFTMKQSNAIIAESCLAFLAIDYIEEKLCHDREYRSDDKNSISYELFTKGIFEPDDEESDLEDEKVENKYPEDKMTDNEKLDTGSSESKTPESSNSNKSTLPSMREIHFETYASIYMTPHLRRSQVFRANETEDEMPHLVKDIDFPFKPYLDHIFQKSSTNQYHWLRFRPIYRMQDCTVDDFMKTIYSTTSAIVLASLIGSYSVLQQELEIIDYIEPTTGALAVIAAAYSNNLQSVKVLLMKKCSAKPIGDMINLNGRTALHWAAAWRNKPMTRALVQYGGDTNAWYRSLITLIMSSFQGPYSRSSTYNDLETTIENLNEKVSWDESYMKVLFDLGAKMEPDISELEKIIETLIEKKSLEKDDMKLLMSLSVAMEPDMNDLGKLNEEKVWGENDINLLIELEKKMASSMSELKSFPLISACSVGDVQSVKFLVENCKVNLHRTLYFNPIEGDSLLGEVFSNPYDNLEVLKILLQNGFNLSRTTREDPLKDITALHYLLGGCPWLNMEILTFVLTYTKSLCNVKVGLSTPIDYEAEEYLSHPFESIKEGSTPLHCFAVSYWYSWYQDLELFTEVISTVCENGADINSKNSKGQTPYEYVCTSECAQSVMLEAFLNNGAATEKSHDSELKFVCRKAFLTLHDLPEEYSSHEVLEIKDFDDNELWALQKAKDHLQAMKTRAKSRRSKTML